jgi:mRNA-degrading endonuclease RelE of RelBE toxin-antitoxin system
METLRDNLQGDVLKLKAQSSRHRLRVGPYRVLFGLAGDRIEVYAVKDRKEAYE